MLSSPSDSSVIWIGGNVSTHSDDCVSGEGVIYTVTHTVTHVKCALFCAKSLNTANVWFSGCYLLSVSHSRDANKGVLFMCRSGTMASACWTSIAFNSNLTQSEQQWHFSRTDKY